MSANDTISQKLMQPFPREAIKTRQGGGNTRLSYVEGHTVIHRLIDATANQFDLRVLNVEQKGDLLTALVELTIPGLGSRQHMGVQKVSERGGEDLVKGAITDAMKKAATLFGVGLELYGPDYGSDEAQPHAPRAPTQQRPPERAQQASPASPTEYTLTDFWRDTNQLGYGDPKALAAYLGITTFKGYAPLDLLTMFRDKQQETAQ